MYIHITETPYYYEEGEELCQALDIFIDEVGFAAPLEMVLELKDEKKEYGFSAQKGSNRFRVIAPKNQASTPCNISVTARVGEELDKYTTPVGNIKPWTIYVAQDKHLDYGWRHPVEEVIHRMNDLTDYYIRLNRDKKSRFNFDCTLWFEEYRNARPEGKFSRLAELLKSGEFEIGAFYAVLFNGIMTEEEFVQCLMPALRMEKEYGIKINTAVPTEVPSLNWGLSTILAGAGIKHILRGSYLLNNQNLMNREPYPLFYWEGPDGSRVLTKFDLFQDTCSFGGYGEARPLRIGSYEERVSFVEEAVRRYQSYENYPFDAILLAGTGWDEYPFDGETVDFISKFNTQGWKYPRLIDATWSDFWSHIESAEARGVKIPVLRGDWGSSWEEWPAHLAYINALYRKAREIVLSGQTAAAIAFVMNVKADGKRIDALNDSFLAMAKFCDHNIGGIAPPEADDMRDRKTAYVYNAIVKGSRVLEGSLADMAFNIRTEEEGILVFNPLSWERDGIIDIIINDPGEYGIIDPATGEEVPCQVQLRGIQPEHYLNFAAQKVPAFGYKVYKLKKCATVEKTEANEVKDEKDQHVLENEYFKLQVDETSGGIVSLRDKRLGRELADKNSPFRLNQFLYYSEDMPYTIHTASITKGFEGAVSKSIVVEGETLRTRVKTVYTLYPGQKHIDILDEIYKEPSTELQSVQFVFPFAVPDREYHFDGTAAIVKPGLVKEGGDQLPGAGMGTYCGIHFADASNEEFGVTVASIDSHLYCFGSNTVGRTEGYISPDNSTVHSVVMMNYNHMDNCSDQGGQKVFAFRYSLFPHQGRFHPAESLKFAKGQCRPLVPAHVGKNPEGLLAKSAASFLSFDNKNVIASGLKVSEDKKSAVLKLRECCGENTTVILESQVFSIISAAKTDLLEREKLELPCVDGKVKLTVKARELLTIKLVFGEKKFWI